MDPRIESQIGNLRESLTNDLDTIRKCFGTSCEITWPKLEQSPQNSRSQFLADIKSRVSKFEENTSPVDWKNVPAWIDKAVESFRNQYRLHIKLFEAIGLTASDAYMDPNDDSDSHEQKINSSPYVQFLRRSLGPNWRACENVHSLQISDAPQPPRGSAEIARDAISRRTNEISAYREALKVQTTAGLHAFRVMWTGLSTDERRKRLHRNFPNLHESAQAEIYAWIRCSDSGRSKIDRRLFLTPLLNVENLCVDEILPNLLRSRATWHPSLFRAVDGRSILLGQHSKSLKLSVPGQMTFASSQQYRETALYSIDYAEDDNVFHLCSPHTVKASTGILQLGAQCMMYGFLAACIDKLSVASDIDDTGPPSSSTQPLCLLARASQLDFDGDPEVVDLKYLATLLASSKDQAMDDLEQLRSDPDSFIEHWRMTSQQDPGRTANFLRPVFQRIDIFESLCNHVEAIEQRVPIKIETAEGAIVPRVPDLTSLHTAFQSSLDEMLLNLKTLSWSPDKSDDSVFSRLFNMVKSCDPAVWIMGLSSAMLVVDRELRKTERCERPLAVMQAVNDISVLAVCVRETWKHVNFDPGVLSWIREVGKFELWWKQQPQPWLSLAEHGYAALGDDQRRKLESCMRQRKADPTDRMRSFWNTIDRCMANSRVHVQILKFIQQRAPIEAACTVQSLSYETRDSFAVSSSITHTKLKRSKRSNTSKRQQSLLSSPTMPRTAPSQTPTISEPVKIKPTRDLDFWRVFTAPSIENDSSLFWSDFFRALEGIGYKGEPQTGSMYRFEYVGEVCEGGCKPGTIVFHKPHQDKVTHAKGQHFWLKRLSRRVQLIL